MFKYLQVSVVMVVIVLTVSCASSHRMNRVPVVDRSEPSQHKADANAGVKPATTQTTTPTTTQAKTYPYRPAEPADPYRSTEPTEPYRDTEPTEPYRATEPADPGRTGNTAVISLLDRALEQKSERQYDQAGATLERAIRIDPRNTEIYYQLASIRLLQENPQQAQQLCLKAMALAGDSSNMRLRCRELGL